MAKSSVKSEDRTRKVSNARIYEDGEMVGIMDGTVEEVENRAQMFRNSSKRKGAVVVLKYEGKKVEFTVVKPLIKEHNPDYAIEPNGEWFKDRAKHNPKKKLPVAPKLPIRKAKA